MGIVGLVGAAGVVAFAAGRPDGHPSVEATGGTVFEIVPELPDVSPKSLEASASAVDVASDLPDRGLHLPLVNIDGWLQSDVTSLEELEGKVVAVQFWTLGCNNWQATLPAMQDLYEKYADEGFEIVGIHAPEFTHEAELANIVDALDGLHVPWPIALDPTKRTFHTWQEGKTGYWPRIYLLDRDGHIRYDHHGEGRYDEIDAAVRALLAENP